MTSFTRQILANKFQLSCCKCAPICASQVGLITNASVCGSHHSLQSVGHSDLVCTSHAFIPSPRQDGPQRIIRQEDLRVVSRF